MNGALHGGHYTIKDGCVFLVKQMLRVSKSYHEQGHHSLLITRQTAQLVCLGCKINNSAVHVTINKSMYVIITNCEQKVTVCVLHKKKLAIVRMLQLLIKL